MCKGEISTKYYYVSDEELEEIEAERGVKVNGGKYYDILMIDNKKIMINKDEIIVQ